MRPFSCPACKHTVFFENSRCLHCGATLGFAPGSREMLAFAPAPDGSEALTRLGSDGPPLRACRTRIEHDACNWMLDPGDPHDLCISCRLTATRPDPALCHDGIRSWAEVEQAKRRLVYGLMRLGLTPQPKQGPDDELGLAFHFLAPVPGGEPVMTGHDRGTITLNLAEADPVHREAVRAEFDEPWRTLLGHLRHEVSHYLQHRWIATDAGASERFRAVFGDERQDYGQALERHHREGPPPDWADTWISAYASSHPHEDWAETCAHVLLVLDAVETAQAWGLSLDSAAAQTSPRVRDFRQGPWDEALLAHWLPVAQFLNAMNRSIGVGDSYPFQMPEPVVRRMAAAATLLREAAQRNSG